MTKRWGDRALGLLLSAGIHLVFLLGAGLVFIEQLLAVDYDVVSSVYGVRDIAPKVEPEPRRDLFERKGVDSDGEHLFTPSGDSEYAAEDMAPLLPGSADIFAYPYLTGGQVAPFPLQVSGKRSQRTFEDRSKAQRLQRDGGNPYRRWA